MTPHVLRLVTYLVPGLPLGLYQTYQYYLEEKLGISVQLSVESRWSGPNPRRKDPFTLDEVDIGFMCSTAYLNLCDRPMVSLLPVAPVHVHPKITKPVYFSEVLIHADNKVDFVDFAHMEGCRWGYNDELSLSGHIVAIKQLLAIGRDLSYFSHLEKTGSHHNSIQQILDKTIDGAAIDCNTLSIYLSEHPEQRSRLHTVCSWGPMPIQPLVINARIKDELKEQLSNALLAINEEPKWRNTLLKYNVSGFSSISHKDIDSDGELQNIMKSAGNAIKTTANQN